MVLKSSNVDAVYTNSEGKLVIRYKSGRIYVYPTAPRKYLSALQKAKSPGKFVWQNLRNKKSIRLK